MYKNLTEMIDAEKSLLLFFEVAAADYGGKLSPAYMNSDDFVIAEKWDKEGFVQFGRIYSKDIMSDKTHWCFLSEDAWKLAHEERKARHERLWSKKNWRSTKDHREKVNP